MPHADSSFIPPSISTKSEFWSHVLLQLQSLLEGQRSWVSNLSNAASLVYNALQAFEPAFGRDERAVNWCGFYLDSALFPGVPKSADSPVRVLSLGPFNGRPACQSIRCVEGKGVCADTFVKRQTLVVPNVEEYPGHIACDGDTKSEIVIPMLLDRGTQQIALGVMDLDCVALEGFDAEDKEGLQKIVQLVVESCNWNV